MPQCAQDLPQRRQLCPPRFVCAHRVLERAKAEHDNEVKHYQKITSQKNVREREQEKAQQEAE